MPSASPAGFDSPPSVPRGLCGVACPSHPPVLLHGKAIGILDAPASLAAAFKVLGGTQPLLTKVCGHEEFVATRYGEAPRRPRWAAAHGRSAGWCRVRSGMQCSDRRRSSRGNRSDRAQHRHRRSRALKEATPGRLVSTMKSRILAMASIVSVCRESALPEMPSCPIGLVSKRSHRPCQPETWLVNSTKVPRYLQVDLKADPAFFVALLTAAIDGEQAFSKKLLCSTSSEKAGLRSRVTRHCQGILCRRPRHVVKLVGRGEGED